MKTESFHTTMFFLNILLRYIANLVFCRFHTTMFFLNTKIEGNKPDKIRLFPYNNVLLKHYNYKALLEIAERCFHTTMFFLNLKIIPYEYSI